MHSILRPNCEVWQQKPCSQFTNVRIGVKWLMHLHSEYRLYLKCTNLTLKYKKSRNQDVSFSIPQSIDYRLSEANLGPINAYMLSIRKQTKTLEHKNNSPTRLARTPYQWEIRLLTFGFSCASLCNHQIQVQQVPTGSRRNCLSGHANAVDGKRSLGWEKILQNPPLSLLLWIDWFIDWLATNAFDWMSLA